MNKKELVDMIATNTNLQKNQVDKVIDELAKCVQVVVGCGDDVTLPGVCKFSSVSRPARTARNPKNGETLNIPAGKKLKITPSTVLKKLVSGK